MGYIGLQKNSLGTITGRLSSGKKVCSLLLNLTGLLLHIGPGKKQQKKPSSMAPRIETDRYPVSGIELGAKAQGAHYREGLYPISNPRRNL